MSDWYYAVDNEQKGPINESELKADLATNKIPGDTLVWKEGMDGWTPANQVQAFSFRPPPTPAKIQPTTVPAAATTPAPEASAAPAKTIASTKASPTVNNPDSTKPMDLASIVGKPEALEVDAEDAEENKVSGILAYLGILVLVPLLTAKDSPFAKYHANQGLVLFIGLIIAFILMGILSNLPGIGWLLGWLYIPLYLVMLGYMVLGILNAANGKCVPLPFIGGIKLLKTTSPSDGPPAA